jgi:hypothetical protein
VIALSLGAFGAGTGAFTGPDMTVIVDLARGYMRPWNDVHAVEVKTYWALA